MGPNRRAQDRERAAAAADKAKRAEAERIAQNDLKIRLVERKRAGSAREMKEAADYLERLAEHKDEIEKAREIASRRPSAPTGAVARRKKLRPRPA